MTCESAARRAVPEWLETWSTGVEFDEAASVFVGDGGSIASFPREGVDLFGEVDEGSFWFDHRYHVISDAVRRLSPSATRVLEVGSGSGAVAARLSSEGYEVVTVEPHQGGAVAARSRGVDVAFQGTLAEAGFPAATFDLVGLFDVIEHLDDWREVLVESRRVLDPAGRLIVTVPAYQWLWSEHDEWNEHKRRYSRRLLEQHLSAAGFDVHAISALFFPLVLPALARRLLSTIRRSTPEDHDVRLRAQLQPPAIVNQTLGAVLAVERRLVRLVGMPIGTSLYAVASPAKVRP